MKKTSRVNQARQMWQGQLGQELLSQIYPIYTKDLHWEERRLEFF